MTTYERREEIRLQLESPDIRLLLARARSMRPRPTPRPADNGLSEVIVARISVTGAPEDQNDDVPELQDSNPGAPEGTDSERPGPTQRALTTTFSGRLVRADEPNLNGAVFLPSDLRYGLPSLAGAPMTWNHESEQGAYGLIEGASLLDHPQYGNHISIDGRLWTARFPDFAQSLLQSLQANQAALSMECMAKAVGCMEPGCGAVATGEGDACPHILQKTAPRRMIQPVFYGAGVILDGVKPGWPDASLVLKS